MDKTDIEQDCADVWEAMRPIGGTFWHELDERTRTLAVACYKDALASRTHPEPVNEPAEWQVEAAARIISPNCMWDAGYVNSHIERRREHARSKARLSLRAASIPKPGVKDEPKPVAWRYSTGDGWDFTDDERRAYREHDARNLVEPLYAAPQPTLVVTDEALMADFDADLANMDMGAVEQAIRSSEEVIDHETPWLEALCAKRRALTAALSPKPGESGE